MASHLPLLAAVAIVLRIPIRDAEELLREASGSPPGSPGSTSLCRELLSTVAEAQRGSPAGDVPLRA